MGHYRTPFDVQELVDHCIFLLSECTDDFKACSLVCSSWVHPAQARLFREIHLYSESPPAGSPAYGSPSVDTKWLRLEQVLHTSPHIVRHIRRLVIDPKDFPPTFQLPTDLRLTHLEQLCMLEVEDSWSGVISNLIGLSTLFQLDM
ncbi:hypothetical protein B0H13DRAFT_2321580 [Mycena leptocephala]|nr:hypothetical protein B0H13DRAFT_2321580 [Mycena leptocephala]